MTRNYFIFIVFILAVVFVFIRTASSKTVDDIINRYLLARGGIDRLNSITSATFEGTRKMFGAEARIKITKVQQKLFRTDFEFEGNNGYSIVTPYEGWLYIFGRSDEPAPLSSTSIILAQPDLDIVGPLVNYKSKGYQASLLEKRIIDDNECHQVQLTSVDGGVAYYFIDCKTDLLLQSRTIVDTYVENAEHTMQPLITNYSDYENVDGVLFPFRITTEGPGIEATTLFFDRIQINVPVEKKLYTRL